MLILLSQGSNFLTLSFEAWKNCIWINIFFLFISCFRSLSNWLLVHHWRLRWKTFGSVIGSWYTVILWRVHIWLSRWSTWWWYSYLNRSFFLLILPWSHTSRLIGILVRLKFILRSIMIHSSLKIIIASVQVLAIVFWGWNSISWLAIAVIPSYLVGVIKCWTFAILIWHLPWLRYARGFIFDPFWQLSCFCFFEFSCCLHYSLLLLFP